MTSLQQLSVDSIDGSGHVGATLCAIHRRCGHALAFTQPQTFDVYQRTPSSNSKWKIVSCFHAHKIFSSVVNVFSVEAYDMFAFVGVTDSHSAVVLVNFLGSIKYIFQLSQRPDIICAEINQKTREILCGYSSGQLACFCLNHGADLQLVRRKALRISVDYTQIIIQLTSLDLVGQVLALSSMGNIICLDGGTFQVTYTIFPHVFSLPPTKLFGDKFGTSFAVLCESGNQQQLEVWSVPRDYASCHAGAFSRVLVPFSDRVLSVHLETPCEYAGSEDVDDPRLIVLTHDRRAHVWALVVEAQTLNFQNSISLNLSAAGLSTNHPNHAKRSLFFSPTCPSGFLAALGRTVIAAFPGAAADVFLYSTPDSVDPLTRQLLLRPRVAKARPPMPHAIEPGRPSAAVTSQVVVLAIDDPDDEVFGDLAPPALDSALHTLESLSALSRPPTGQDPIAKQASVMTDTLRDESFLSEESVVVPPSTCGVFDQVIDVEPSLNDVDAKSMTPQPTYGLDYLFPECFLGAAGDRAVFTVHSSRGIVLRGDGRLQVPHPTGLRTLSPIEAMEQPASDPAQQILLCSVAMRAGRLAVVSALKDSVNVYGLGGADGPPLQLPLCVRQQSAVTSLTCVDMFIREPIAGKAEEGGKKLSGKVSGKVSVPFLATSYGAAFVGDSEGFVHFYIYSCNGTAAMQMVHADRFRAYTSSGVCAIMTTGDCMRPLWTLALEADVSVERSALYSLVPCAGSAIVTMARDGEIKVWQPHPSGKSSPSLQVVLAFYKPLFRLAGVFTVQDSVAVRGGEYAQKRSECLALAPGCMHLLVSAGERVQQWAIPGIVETPERTLATTQGHMFASESVHSGGVTSLRMCLPCDELSAAREVLIADEGARDQALAGLGMYARAPFRSRRTLGYTYGQVKSMRDIAGLVTCGGLLDCSIVVWTFESRAWLHCAALFPKPVRRLVFSNAPTQALAFPPAIVAAASSVPMSWAVSALIDGLSCTVLHGPRHKVFSDESNTLGDNRDAGRALVHFNDDLLPRKPLTPLSLLFHVQAVLRPGESLDLAPVLSSVPRPPALVQCYKVQQEVGRAGGGVLALLEQWAKIGDGSAVEVAQLVSEAVTPPTAGPAHAAVGGAPLGHFDAAMLSLPPRPQSPNAQPLPSLLHAQMREAESSPSSPQPAKLDVTFPTPPLVGNLGAAEYHVDKVKFLARGLWMEAERADAEFARSLIEQNQSGRFVLAKERPPMSEIQQMDEHLLAEVGMMDPLGLQFPSHDPASYRSVQYSVAMPSDVLVTDRDLSSKHVSDADGNIYIHAPGTPAGPPPGTPDHRLYAPQLEDYLSRPASRERGVDGQDEASVVSAALSHRTQITVDSVKYRQDQQTRTVLLQSPFDRHVVQKERESAHPAPRGPDDPRALRVGQAAAVPKPLYIQQQPKGGIKYVSKTTVLKHEMVSSKSTVPPAGSSAVTSSATSMSLVGDQARARMQALAAPSDALSLATVPMKKSVAHQLEAPGAQPLEPPAVSWPGQSSPRSTAASIGSRMPSPRVTASASPSSTAASAVAHPQATALQTSQVPLRAQGSAPLAAAARDAPSASTEANISESPYPTKPPQSQPLVQPQQPRQGRVAQEPPPRADEDDGRSVHSEASVDKNLRPPNLPRVPLMPRAHAARTRSPARAVAAPPALSPSKTVVDRRPKPVVRANPPKPQREMTIKRGMHLDDEEADEDVQLPPSAPSVDNTALSSIDLKSNVLASTVSNPAHALNNYSDLAQSRAAARAPKGRVVLPQKKEPIRREPAIAPRKAQAVTLDHLPDKRAESRQRAAQIVSKALESRGAEKVEDLVTLESPDSLITHYFDRNSKPIFVDRQKAEQQSRHQTKRHGEQGGEDGEGNELMEEGEGLVDGRSGRAAVQVPTSSKGSRGDGRAGDTRDPVNRADQMMVALLQSLTEDQRRMLDSLSPEQRERLMRDLLNGQQRGQQIDAQALRESAERAIDESKSVALLRMDMVADETTRGDRDIVFTICSQSGGPVHAVLLFGPQASPLPPPTELCKFFQATEALRTLPGFVGMESITLLPRAEEDVRFGDLRPDSKYLLLVCPNYLTPSPVVPKQPSQALKTRPPFVCISGTAPEVLEVQWECLSAPQQRVELRAAIRSELVQLRAACSQPPIYIPMDDEVANLATVPSRSKQVLGFLDWWAGASTGQSRVRADFLYYEVLVAGQDRVIAAEILQHGCLGAGEIEALSQMCARAFKEAQDAVFANKPLTYLFTAETAQLKDERFSQTSQTSQLSEGSASALSEGQIFLKFRSWYRAGQAIRDLEARDKARLAALFDATVENAEAGASPRMDDSVTSVPPLLDQRLENRAMWLTHRVAALDENVALVRRLNEGYLYASKKGLKEVDLLMRRGELSSADLAAIMCAKKLIELLLARRLLAPREVERLKEGATTLSLQSLDQRAPFPALMGRVPSRQGAPPRAPIAMASEEVMLQRVGDLDLLREADPAGLRPDDPPAVLITPLPGTSRKPLKPWQLLSEADRRLELALACSLVYVQELCVEDAVEIPDPEDFTLPPDQFLHKGRLCTEFRAWYAGGEEADPVPGRGVPTLQRVLFAERFESETVEKDCIHFVQTMKDKGLPLPRRFLSPPPSAGAPDGEAAVPAVASTDLGPDGGGAAMEDFESLTEAYARAIDMARGTFLRADLMACAMNHILQSRRLSLVKFLWPPGLNRIGRQFLFPRMGVLVPAYELPQARRVLFPSRTRDAVSFEEATHWYTAGDLDVDDVLMQQAEARGVKQRAYHDWLAKDEERVAEARQLMEVEDRESLEARAALQYLESLFQTHEERNVLVDAQLDEGTGVDGAGAEEGHMRFRLIDQLPKEYWYIFEESVEYKHGSGIWNDDEAEDMLLLQKEVARKALEDAKEFERYLNEEKKRRDVEEGVRQKREDQDRRLKEGVARRRQIREHLEELKRQRALRQEEEALELLRQREDELQEELLLEEERRLEEEARWEEEARQREQVCMAREEALTRDHKVAVNELRAMEHEDVRSFLFETAQRRLAAQQEAHVRELENVYAPFEPFRFKQSRVHLPALHGILREAQADDDDLFVDEGSDEDSHYTQQTASSYLGSTTSTKRHRASRIRNIYGQDGHLDAPTGVEASQRDSPNERSRPGTRPALAPSSGSVSSSSAARASSVAASVVGLLPSAPALDVRQRDHNASKAQLYRLKRATSGSVLPFNPYDTQWELTARPQSPSLLPTVPASGLFQRPALRSLRAAPTSLTLGGATRTIPFPSAAQLVTGSLEGSVDSAQLGSLQRGQLEAQILQEHPLGNSVEQLDVDEDDHEPEASSLEGSIFRAPADSQAEPSKARLRLKRLLTTSAALLQRQDPGAYVDSVLRDRALTFASLTTMDHLLADPAQGLGALGVRRRQQQKIFSASMPALAPLAAPSTSMSASVSPLAAPSARADVGTALLQQLGLGQPGRQLLDFKTRSLAASASDSVLRMRRDRELLRQYISGGAVFESDGYLQACMPGEQPDLLDANPVVRTFAAQIHEALQDAEAVQHRAASPKATSPPTRRKPKAALVPAPAPSSSSTPRLGAILGASLARPEGLAAQALRPQRTVLQRLPTKPTKSTKPAQLAAGALAPGASTASMVQASTASEGRSLRAPRSVDLFIDTPRTALMDFDSPPASVVPADR